MRVTSETMVMRSLDRLQARLQQYELAQSRLASGKRIASLSDDPATARRGMSLRGDIRIREQQLRNASDAQGWLDTSDRELQSAWSRLQRVRDLAVRAGATSDTQERRALALEAQELSAEIAAIANTTHLGRPLFGGFTDGVAVERDSNGLWRSNGDSDEITRRLGAEDVVRVNVTAAEWLGFGSPDGDLLTLLDGLVAAIEHAPAGSVSAMISDLDAAAERIGDTLAVVGSTANRVVSTRDRVQDVLYGLRAELSDVEDVDIAEGIMELHTQQVAYEATLQSLAKALPPSLAAFLR